MKRNFVVVAAHPEAREALAGSLRAQGYTVTRAESGAATEKVVRGVAVDAVLIESHLPDTSAEKLAAKIHKLRPECRTVIVTSFDQLRDTPERLGIGAGRYLVGSDQLLDLVQAPFSRSQDEGGDIYHRQGHDALIRVVDVLVGLLELDDHHFGGFSHQAMRLAQDVAAEVESDEEVVVELQIATLLRDIGKVGVDPDLLFEPGRYSAEQRERMQAHVDASLKLFEHIDFPWKVLPIIRHHHERYDGTGYPDGLRGREIPMGARIVAVVDAFVALTSGRSHREAVPPDQALKTLTGEAGRQFDPEVIEALQRVIDRQRRDLSADEKPCVSLVNLRDDLRKVAKIGLLNAGFEVVETEDLDQALTQLLEKVPSMVLVDTNGEVDEAFAFLREVREDPTLCGVPVAFLAHQPGRVFKIRALRDGVDDVFCTTDDLEEIVARVQNIVERETVRRDGKTRRARRGITGDLEHMGFAEIIQTLAVGMKTARLTLRQPEGKGRVWLENGTVRHAALNGTEGEAAFYEMVRWTEGEFVIEHGVRSKSQSLNHDAMFLVMEGLRLLDEAASLEAQPNSA